MDEMPLLMEDYLNYMESIRGVSENTVKEYFLDLRMFFRFLKKRYRMIGRDEELSEIDIGDIDLEFIKRINIQDMHAYIAYADKVLENGSSAKARKIASVRSFFEYLHITIKLIDDNPALALETPKQEKRNPIYLTLEESKQLLNVILDNPNEEYRFRDYAIIMIFLNCGLRLSELSSINLDMINGDMISIIGKGNKERVIYLNEACLKAINNYLDVRPDVDEKALFISKRRNRLSNRAIQHMVDRYLSKALLDTSKYSTHSLRHTAATLMYKYGNVDIRTIQEILGHESVATTQIYTHLDDEVLRDAVKSNPLGIM